MLAALAACSADHAASYDARDPCAALAITPLDATPVELDGISGAISLWRDRGVSAFDPALAADPPAVAIRFDDAAEAFHGVYDPASATIAINRGITDRTTLAIVVAHELGHVFGLAHVATVTRASLMNPGNLVTPPTDADQRTLEALWGTCR
jgi:Zn-dependent protease with chaperone function